MSPLGKLENLENHLHGGPAAAYRPFITTGDSLCFDLGTIIHPSKMKLLKKVGAKLSMTGIYPIAPSQSFAAISSLVPTIGYGRSNADPASTFSSGLHQDSFVKEEGKEREEGEEERERSAWGMVMGDGKRGGGGRGMRRKGGERGYEGDGWWVTGKEMEGEEGKKRKVMLWEEKGIADYERSEVAVGD
ncbi:hypothetical protein ACH5RR_039198 [Cinchona calisaya]|uniref:Uncharacterized protein n=1 Tax=Cinchona calisaya TaxID=153742 RepID=A0ABD2Y0F4_9GENT